MRHYEIMFIMNAALPEDGRRDTIERVEDEIEQLDGTVHRSKDYDVRQLAYQIDDATRGHYRLMRFEVDPGSVQTLKERLRLVEDVLRFLVVRPEDEQLAFVSSDSSDEDEDDEVPEETDEDETSQTEVEDDAETEPDDEDETAEVEEDRAAEAT